MKFYNHPNKKIDQNSILKKKKEVEEHFEAQINATSNPLNKLLLNIQKRYELFKVSKHQAMFSEDKLLNTSLQKIC